MCARHPLTPRRATRTGAWQELVRLAGCTLGAIAVTGAVSGIYVLIREVLYPTLSHPQLLGPTASTALVVGLAQYAGYALMALLVFRYLARLRPFAISLKGDATTLRPHNGAGFWLPLIALLVVTNRVHVQRGSLSPPTLTFDVALFLLLGYRYTRQGPDCLTGSAPIILFLRPFASFSDRSLLSTVLNSLPPGSQAVFLVPRSEPLRSLDPYGLGLAGLRLAEPCRSAPIALLAADSEWEACVRYLIERSRWIVIDVSQMTPALEIEIGLLDQLGARERTIVCVAREKTPAAAANARPAAAWHAVVEFDKPRQVGRALLALGMSLLALWGMLLDLTAGAALPGWANALLTAAFGLAVLRFWAVVFLKRAVGSRAAAQLQALMAGPGGRRPGWRWAALALVAAAVLWLGRAAESWHVVAGRTFDVRAAATLIGGPGDERPPDPHTLEAAEWQVLPTAARLDVAGVQASPATVAWVDAEGPHAAEGLTLGVRGQAQAPPATSAVTLVLTLRGPARERPAPRLLYGLAPEPPAVLGDDLVWAVDGWQVHPTEYEARAACLLDFAKMLLLIGAPVAIVVAGWRVMKR